MSTSALPTLRLALRQLPRAVGTAGPQLPASDLSGHGWTSTARVWAQWASLDLNLGPPELSKHRWTSTWDPPSSVSTAGPQWPDRMPEDMPDRTPDRMSERMPEDMPDKVPEWLPDRMPENMPDRMPEGMPDRMSDRMPEGMPDKVPECLPDRTPEDLPDRMPDRMSEDMPEDMPEHIAEDMPEDLPEDMPDRMPEDMPDKMPEDMSDRMPEDLPVTKRIDVMVGITRSKVFFVSCFFLTVFFYDLDNGKEPWWHIFLAQVDALVVLPSSVFFHLPGKCDRLWFASVHSGGVTEAINKLLVGGIPTPLKNISQMGVLFPIYGK